MARKKQTGNGRQRGEPASGKAEGEPVRDALQMLEAQHRAVEGLFRRLSRPGASKDSRRELIELADLLTAHMIVEERHFYPVVRSERTQELVDEAFEEHAQIKDRILHLLDREPDDSDFAPGLEELRAAVDEHISMEEDELFPIVLELLTGEQLEGLAQEMTAATVELQEEGAPHERLPEVLGGES